MLDYLIDVTVDMVNDIKKFEPAKKQEFTYNFEVILRIWDHFDYQKKKEGLEKKEKKKRNFNFHFYNFFLSLSSESITHNSKTVVWKRKK